MHRKIYTQVSKGQCKRRKITKQNYIEDASIVLSDNLEDDSLLIELITW